MLNIGMTELLIFGIIALLVLGPDKLPDAVRFVGIWYGKVTRTVSNLQNDFDRELRLSELREQMQSEMKRIQELEAKMQAQMSNLQNPIETTPSDLPPKQTLQTLNYQLIQVSHPKNYVMHPNKITMPTPQPYLDKKYLCTRQISQNPYPIRILPS